MDRSGPAPGGMLEQVRAAISRNREAMEAIYGRLLPVLADPGPMAAPPNVGYGSPTAHVPGPFSPAFGEFLAELQILFELQSDILRRLDL